MPAKENSVVTLHYTIQTEEGHSYSSKESGEPLELKLGEGNMLPAIEAEIVGMSAKENKQFSLKEEQGIPHIEDLIFSIEKDKFPEEMTLEQGMQIELQQEGGSSVIATIMEIEEDKVKLDANHPLAGKPLKVDIEVLEIKE